VIEQWRVEYNTPRPHSALGYRATLARRGSARRDSLRPRARAASNVAFLCSAGHLSTSV